MADTKLKMIWNRFIGKNAGALPPMPTPVKKDDFAFWFAVIYLILCLLSLF